MIEQVLDFDRDVVRQAGVRGVQRLDDAHGVRRAVEKIGIAKGDVARAGRDLRVDIREHDLLLNDAELPVVDRDDRAVAAQVPAAAARFGVARHAAGPVAQVHGGVAPERQESRSIGRDEMELRHAERSHRAGP